MNRIIRSASCIFAAVAMLASCTEEAQPVQYQAPEVSFPMSSDFITALVGEEIEFRAEVVSGDKVSTAWYINDVIAASSQTFSTSFDTAGEYSVRFVARNGAGSKEHSYTVSVSDRLSITLSVGDSLRVERLQLDYIKVAAIVEYGSNVKHEWKVDGEVLGTESFFSCYQMVQAREYLVQYCGSNSCGSFQKSFTVVANERPLEVSFSVLDGVASIKAGASFSVTASALYGGTGLTHKWFLNDSLVSTDASFDEVFSTAGEYTLRYLGENAKGETAQRTWTISVIQSGYMYEDYENFTYFPVGTKFSSGKGYTGNNNALYVTENPHPSKANSSTYVLADDMTSSSSGTSGYIQITLQEDKLAASERSKYIGVRIKVYMGKAAYYPRFQYDGKKYLPSKVNGSAISTENDYDAAVKRDDWNTFELSFPDGKKLSDYASQQVHFRPFSVAGGGNSSGAATESNPRLIYIDDIEFFD